MKTVYIDGSCLGNPGPIGWAVVDTQSNYIASGHPDGTNNRAELSAAIEALNCFRGDITLVTDSTYVAGPWKGDIAAYLNRVVKNKDLWLKLYRLTLNRTVSFQWAPRNSTPELKLCDSLAKGRASLYKS